MKRLLTLIIVLTLLVVTGTLVSANGQTRGRALGLAEQHSVPVLAALPAEQP